MKNYLFKVKPEFSLTTALQELKKKGLQNHYVIEDVATEDYWVGGIIDINFNQHELISVVLKGPNEINWSSQWETFAENFHNGMAHIDLSPFGTQKSLHLLPGAGFGDLSHPTTYLMIDLMQDRMFGESIVDIGAGSGILALCAKLMGAKMVIGIENDIASLYHAQKNALKNQLDVSFTETLSLSSLKEKSIFLMNMTFQEQVNFMKNHPNINQHAHTWIISGILDQQKEKYLQQIKQWNWELKKIKIKNKWLGAILTVST